LTVLVDHNNLQGFGSTADVASMSPLWDKLQGFDVGLQIVDGHDPDAIYAALNNKGQRLRIIILRTIKGHGVSFMENRMESHYLSLSDSQYHQAIEEIKSR
jgi:transketolase